MEERQLIINAKKGDKNAFCSLYSLYSDRLYRYAFYRLGSKEDAEDAVSDCVLSAYRQIKNIRKPEAFPSWLFTILRFSCNAIIKRQAVSRNNADINEQSGIASENESVIEKTELRAALENLREEDREIVLLSVVFGLNSKEIAKLTDLTAGAVRSKLSRSLKRMREFLG